LYTVTFADYKRRLRDCAAALGIYAAADGWMVIEKARSRENNLTFETATEGTRLDIALVREGMEQRRQAGRAYAAGQRIYELLQEADADDDLVPEKRRDLVQYAHDQLLPSSE
jgi:hypothetical protein